MIYYPEILEVTMKFSFYKRFKSKIHTYEPYQYWYESGKTYQNKFTYSEDFKLQEKIFLNVLKEMSFESVLEFGCGFGRMTKLVLENFPIKKYVAFDLSPHQIENAKKNCSSFEVDFQVSTVQDFRYKEKFDLVFGSEVLLHIKPIDIKKNVKHLLDFARENMLNIDFFPIDTPDILAKHNFIHSYEKIYLEFQNVKAVVKTPITNKQCIFNAKIN